MAHPNPADYADLFRMHYPGVLGMVVLILRDRGRAEEVTQDAFLKLYERWDAANRVDHPAAWVRTVAVRAAIRRGRRDAAQAPSPAPMEDPTYTDLVPDIDLRHALARLAPKQRAAVALYYLDDRPVDEVARLMEVTPSTVKQHLHRARAELALALAESAESAEEVGVHD